MTKITYSFFKDSVFKVSSKSKSDCVELKGRPGKELAAFDEVVGDVVVVVVVDERMESPL